MAVLEDVERLQFGHPIKYHFSTEQFLREAFLKFDLPKAVAGRSLVYSNTYIGDLKSREKDTLLLMAPKPRYNRKVDNEGATPWIL